MVPKYGESVYLKLSKILGLNFKAQIKESGIVLNAIYQMRNLVSEKSHYLLIVDDRNIVFQDKTEFLTRFISHLQGNLTRFNEEAQEISKRKTENFVDKYALHDEDEYIGYCGSKQEKLLEKIYGFLGRKN